jgi:hypothetical protein
MTESRVREVMIQAVGLPFDANQGDLTADLRMEGGSRIRSDAWTMDPGAIRVWNLQPNTDQIVVSINQFLEDGDAQLSDRSPANDRWVLRIYNENANTNSLFQNLETVTDIKIRFSIKGFSAQ